MRVCETGGTCSDSFWVKVLRDDIVLLNDSPSCRVVEASMEAPMMMRLLRGGATKQAWRQGHCLANAMQ